MRHIQFFRHGKAKPAEPGQKDRDRQLSDVGMQQAIARGNKTDFTTLDSVISSPTPRAFMTAHLATKFPVDRIVKLDVLYPEPEEGHGRELDRLFNLPHLGYAPVAAYLAEKGGNCVLDWAGEACDQLVRIMLASHVRTAIFGHAVCLPALGMAFCATNKKLIDEISQINLGEAEGYEITFEHHEPIAVTRIS